MTLTLVAMSSSFRACHRCFSRRNYHCHVLAAYNVAAIWRFSGRRRLPRTAATTFAHTSTIQVRCFSNGNKRAGGGPVSSSQELLSRRQKRKIERELKRKKKKKRIEVSTSSSSSKSWGDKLEATVRRFRPRPRIPGGSADLLQSDRLLEIAKRLPLFLIGAWLLVTSDDTPPLKVDRALGPSMLPTILPLGDVFLRDNTDAWKRVFGGIQQRTSYQVGDVVAIQNPCGGGGEGYSCKRIIGVEGDKVLRYGQFADLYTDREDLGIVAPSRPVSCNLSWDADDDGNASNWRDVSRTFIVPPGHVWVEGDNPLFSIDSRHYGPVHMDSVRGRLLMRLWPLWRGEGVRSSPVIMSRDRPVPLTAVESMAIGYNLYRKSVPVQED